MSRQQISAVIILAAGAGTRMNSAKPKVLHAIAGRSLLHHAIVAANELEPNRLVVVVRHERDAVAAEASAVAPDTLIADQDDIPGTGRAVYCGLTVLDATAVAGAVAAGTVGAPARDTKAAFTGSTGASDESPPPAPERTAHVVGWHSAILNVNAVCDVCNALLPKGSRAGVGIVTGGGAIPFRCSKCLAELSDGGGDPPGA